jgi:repressor LexA
MQSLPTKRQKEIAEYLYSEMSKHGIMPTQRDIAARFGFSSRNAVRSHLRLMEKKGMITRLPGKARGLKLNQSASAGIPLLGRIVAGEPQAALQETDESVPVSSQLFRGTDLFALRVKGDSMKDAGILHGDIAVLNRQPDIRDGEIAAVLFNDDATLKYFHRRRGSIVLRGANTSFSDIVIQIDAQSSLRILGKYVGLVRPKAGAI